MIIFSEDPNIFGELTPAGKLKIKLFHSSNHRMKWQYQIENPFEKRKEEGNFKYCSVYLPV